MGLRTLSRQSGRNRHAPVLATFCALVLSGCFQRQQLTSSTDTTSTGTSTTSTSTSTSLPSGAKAVKIIFKSDSTTGSFDAPANATAGTAPTAGSGHQVVRLFDTDGTTLLASGGPGSTGWPAWISSAEIGLSGTDNTKATNPNCARFVNPATETNLSCSFASGAQNCAGPGNYYRVSEYDCKTTGTITPGDGSEDGVYIRINFDRSSTSLGATENIMAVLEYAASGLRKQANPANCFTAGKPTPENCADHTWKIFLKTSASAAAQPYLLLTPPVDYFETKGNAFSTKQFYLPLAGDSTLNTLQISRIDANPDASYSTACVTDGGAGTGNSPYCVGMVLISLTLYRI